MPDHRHAALLVEDHDDFREALRALISDTGLDAVAAHSGAEGLEHLRREPHRWCLVVLDWWRHDMTGEEFRRQQLADPRIAGIHVAVVTGDARVKESAERFGVEHCLLKPVDPDLIVGLLSHRCGSTATAWRKG